MGHLWLEAWPSSGRRGLRRGTWVLRRTAVDWRGWWCFLGEREGREGTGKIQHLKKFRTPCQTQAGIGHSAPSTTQGDHGSCCTCGERVETKLQWVKARHHASAIPFWEATAVRCSAPQVRVYTRPSSIDRETTHAVTPF